MKISQHIHRKLRIKKMLGTLVLLIVLSLLAWLSTLYNTQFDITTNSSNTLSSASQNVLNSLPGPVDIKAYIKKDPALRSQITHLLDRYHQFKPDLRFTFIDPDSQPDKVRKLEIPSTGALFVEYQGRNQRISFLDEATLTNALLQLASADEHWISFLTGHGERSPEGHANFDLGRFGEELAQRNIKTQKLNLADIPAIPDNSALLVIASPNVSMLPGELTLIVDYIDRGGNLLWLNDPDNPTISELEQLLGVKRLPGIVIDDSAGLYGIDDPSFVLVSRYSGHPVTQKMQTLTLFPIVSAWTEYHESEFSSETLLKSSEKSWTETGTVNGDAQFDADAEEQEGPLNLAYALSRNLEGQSEQRIIVIGDGDFLSNSFIGNVGNLDLGVKMINWLIQDDSYIDIPVKTAPDKKLALTPMAVAIIGFGFLVIVPLVLIVTGLIIWRKRKNR
ncbi:MAG: GldG family protein [Gammaproteobacteria bacterium]